MSPEILSKLIPTAVLLVACAIEAYGGLYFHDKRTRNDFSIEIISSLLLPIFVQPGIFLFVFWIGGTWFAHYDGAFMDLAVGWQFLAFLIFDDLTQYWWHRLSHSNRMMWKLHRPHHVIQEMGVMVAYRNAVLYYALMPGIWLSGILVFLGMGYVYLFYLPLKLTITTLAHSEIKWDQYLYKYKILHPLAWVVERTISTPSTHFAHHGLTAEDGVSHPNGNYGNMLFLWDILFGTAKITRRYPTKFGAWNQINEHWTVQLFFPFVRSKDERSELHRLTTKSDYDPSVAYKEVDS